MTCTTRRRNGSAARGGWGPTSEVAASLDGPLERRDEEVDQLALRTHLSEKGVRLAQKMQVGPCIPAGMQL
jgi:hypothetical protein